MGATPTLPHVIGNKVSTTLSTGINASTTTIPLTSGSGFNPNGGYIIIDKGLSTEELIYLESVSGTTGTASSDGRGRGGTSAAAHSSGAIVYDVLIDEHIEGIRTKYLIEHNIDGTHILSSGTLLGLATQWIPLGQTLTYVSADNPTGVVKVTGVDVTSYLSVGMKIKFTNGGNIIYGIITAIAFSTDTTITFLHEMSNNVAVHLIANSAITLPYFSTARMPFNFPPNPNSWSLILTDTNKQEKTSPASGTWYGDATFTTGSGLKIDIPIGLWNVKIMVNLNAQSGTTVPAEVFSTLSTGSTTESNPEFTTLIRSLTGTSETRQIYGNTYKESLLSLAAKTTHYLNIKTTNASLTTIAVRGDLTTSIIKIVCQYI